MAGDVANSHKNGIICSMSQIVLGPFLSRNPAKKNFSGFTALNVNLEFAATDHAANLPLYLKNKDSPSTFPFFYFMPAYEISWKIIYRPFFSHQVEGVLLLPLDEVLLSIFKTFKSPRGVMSLLTELRDFVTLPEKFERNKWHGQKLLKEPVAVQGLRVTEYFAYGRAQHISLRWFPPQDADQEGSPLAVSLGGFELLAQPDGEFSQGKWRAFRSDHNIGCLVRKEPGAVMKVAPITLLSEEGLEIAKREFKWQPVHFMTPKELRVARLDFVKKHPDLWSDPKTLARALQEAKLYQKETDLGHIRRSIPKFLEEVQKAKSEI